MHKVVYWWLCNWTDLSHRLLVDITSLAYNQIYHVCRCCDYSSLDVRYPWTKRGSILVICRDDLAYMGPSSSEGSSRSVDSGAGPSRFFRSLIFIFCKVSSEESSSRSVGSGACPSRFCCFLTLAPCIVSSRESSSRSVGGVGLSRFCRFLIFVFCTVSSEEFSSRSVGGGARPFRFCRFLNLVFCTASSKESSSLSVGGAGLYRFFRFLIFAFCTVSSEESSSRSVSGGGGPSRFCCFLILVFRTVRLLGFRIVSGNCLVGTCLTP